MIFKAKCECNGHGTCTTIENLDLTVNGVFQYTNWDVGHTTACICDIGYTGSGCALSKIFYLIKINNY